MTSVVHLAQNAVDLSRKAKALAVLEQAFAYYEAPQCPAPVAATTEDAALEQMFTYFPAA